MSLNHRNSHNDSNGPIAFGKRDSTTLAILAVIGREPRGTQRSTNVADVNRFDWQFRAFIHSSAQLPSPVVEATSQAGALVNFTITASNDDGDSSVSCTPNSGTTFPLGTTKVNCTAVDAKLASLSATASFDVVVHDTTAPTLNLPSNVVANAVAPNGAPVSYIVSASDVVDPNPAISCAPASGSTFAIGTTTVTCNAKDFSGNTSSGSFTILVKAAADQVNDLIALVNSFDLRHGIQNSLDVKLQNAESALASANVGDRSNVCNLMSAFINETNAQSGKAITADEAGQLLTAANRIRGVLACP